ncbi:hypothetical protein AGMMS49574_14760 [Bacteroidia bacterium]|nr:hypothetical protein AGMMS49574_14760 [Bacteroidia bacterium]
MVNRSFILLCLIVLCVLSCYSQTMRVTAIGSWDMSGLTVERAKMLALENAKENALRETGISEEFILINTGTISERVTHFVSYSNSELLGEITNYKVLDEHIQQDGKIYFSVVKIEATIKKGKVKRDLEFEASIDNIKIAPYRNGEDFIFTIKPYKDCYVNIFWIDEEGKGALIYPNAAEATELLHAGEIYTYPRTQRYRAKKESKERTEVISLVFAFTKSKIPFTNTCNLDNIQRWIMTIPSDKRIVKYNTIVITD